MEATDEQYWECPVCGWVIKFRFDYEKGNYVSLCPYCKDILEISKSEYEDESNDSIEKFFEFDY